MSRTRHGRKGPGFEYWSSRLHNYCDDPGSETKTITRRRERRTARQRLALTGELPTKQSFTRAAR